MKETFCGGSGKCSLCPIAEGDEASASALAAFLNNVDPIWDGYENTVFWSEHISANYPGANPRHVAAAALYREGFNCANACRGE